MRILKLLLVLLCAQLFTQYALAQDNLLTSAVFEADVNGNLAGSWQSSQHTQNTSYRFLVSDGELVIERFDVEPWGQAVQRIDARPLAGKTLTFTAELSGDFTREFGEPMEPSGLAVVIQGRHEDPRYRMMGTLTLATHTSDLDIEEGVLDWTPVVLNFEVPATASNLQLAIKMTLGGTLRARNPKLIVQED